MTGSRLYKEELDYLVAYAHDALVYFFVVRDAAEKLAGSGATEDAIRDMTVQLVGDMVDAGISVGDISEKPDVDFEPWGLPKGEVLERIRREMDELDDSDSFLQICWFGSV
ncbi:hypothetical protein ACWCYY_19455 [Kitasatospora sp. NPDC001664]